MNYGKAQDAAREETKNDSLAEPTATEAPRPSSNPATAAALVGAQSDSNAQFTPRESRKNPSDVSPPKHPKEDPKNESSTKSTAAKVEQISSHPPTTATPDNGSSTKAGVQSNSNAQLDANTTKVWQFMDTKILLCLVILALAVLCEMKQPAAVIQPETSEDTITRRFILWGTTGSGKTTFANHAMGKEFGIGKVGANSETTALTTYTGKAFRRTIRSAQGDKKVLMNLELVDTVGVDAADQNSATVMKNLLGDLLTHAPMANGFVLVHKMERLRQGYLNELKEMSRVFTASNIKPKHILMVITHSAMYNKHVQREYTTEVCGALKFWFGSTHSCLDRAHHFNFVNLTEVDEELHPFFNKSTRTSQERLWDLMAQYDESFNVNELFGDVDARIESMFEKHGFFRRMMKGLVGSERASKGISTQLVYF